MIQIQQIIHFQKIAELKSMNKAADALFLNQSSLSHSIRNLEEELGVQLLIRSNKGVLLTEDGRKFLEYGQNVLKQLEVMNHMFDEDGRRQLSVASYPMLANGAIVSAFYNANRQMQDLRFTLEEVRVDTIMNRVTHSQAELGLIQYNQRQEADIRKMLKQNALEFHKMAVSTWFAAVSVNHPVAKQQEVDIHELPQYPVIRASDDYFSTLTSYMKVDGMSFTEFHKCIFVNDGITKMNILRATDAFTFAPEWARQEYERQSIRMVPIHNCDIEVTLGWIKRKKEQLSAEGMNYIDTVMHFFNN